MNRRESDQTKPSERRQAPAQVTARARPCPKTPPPALDGGDKKGGVSTTARRQDLLNGETGITAAALKAIADSANADRGPGYRKRMMSLSGLERNSQRVRKIEG